MNRSVYNQSSQVGSYERPRTSSNSNSLYQNVSLVNSINGGNANRSQVHDHSHTSSCSNEQYNYSNELVKRPQTVQYSNYSPERVKRNTNVNSSLDPSNSESFTETQKVTSMQKARQFDAKRATAELDQIIDDLLNFSGSAGLHTISRSQTFSVNGNKNMNGDNSNVGLLCSTPQNGTKSSSKYYVTESISSSATDTERYSTLPNRTSRVTVTNVVNSVEHADNNRERENEQDFEHETVVMRKHKNQAQAQPESDSIILNQVRVRQDQHNQPRQIFTQTHNQSTYQNVFPMKTTVITSRSHAGATASSLDEQDYVNLGSFSNANKSVAETRVLRNGESYVRRSQETEKGSSNGIQPDAIEETRSQYQTARVEVYEEVESIALEPIGKGVHDLMANSNRISTITPSRSSATLNSGTAASSVGVAPLTPATVAAAAAQKMGAFVEQDVEVVTFQPIGSGVKDLGAGPLQTSMAPSVKQQTLPRSATMRSPSSILSTVNQQQEQMQPKAQAYTLTLNRHAGRTQSLQQPVVLEQAQVVNDPSNQTAAKIEALHLKNVETDIPTEFRPVSAANAPSATRVVIRNTQPMAFNSTANLIGNQPRTEGGKNASRPSLNDPESPTTNFNYRTDGSLSAFQQDSPTDSKSQEIIVQTRYLQPADYMRTNVYATMLKSSKTMSSLPTAANAYQSSPNGSPNGAFLKTSPSINHLTDAYGRANSYNSSLAFATSPDDVQRRLTMIHDRSRWWYKPNMPRDEIVKTLLNMRIGSFIVRKSTTYAGGYGLAIRVEEVPSSAPKSGDPEKDLIRHFLIEPTSKGVRVRGFPNEPVFTSLSALIYQHTVSALGLPCRLILPDFDPAPLHNELNQSNLSLMSIAKSPTQPEGNLASAQVDGLLNSIESLSSQPGDGPNIATTVIFVGGVDVESLSGPQALVRAFLELQAGRGTSLIEAKLTMNLQGVTITDVHRKYFFRKHLALSTVLYSGTDPEDRRLTDLTKKGGSNSKLWGIVARKQTGPMSGNTVFENICYLFAELPQSIPLTGLVSFLGQLMQNSAATSP